MVMTWVLVTSYKGLLGCCCSRPIFLPGFESRVCVCVHEGLVFMLGSLIVFHFIN